MKKESGWEVVTKITTSTDEREQIDYLKLGTW